MANNVKVKINSSGAREILNSAGVQSDLLHRANGIKRSAESMGNGTFEADVQAGKCRAHAMVKTTDIVSIRSNAKNNTLLKAMGSGK